MALFDVSGSLGAQGQPRMKAVCDGDGCDREEVFANPQGDEGRARKKILEMGWAVIGETECCPKCKAKRKAAKMAARRSKQQVVNGASETPLREPTRAQRREIMGMLEVSYDVDAGRYAGGETDETLAKVLNVLPGWVAAIRAEFFGEAGGNEEIQELREALTCLALEIGITIDTNLKSAKLLSKQGADVKALTQRLEKLEKSYGPRAIVRGK